jgi:hypothetical protein
MVACTCKMCAYIHQEGHTLRFVYMLACLLVLWWKSDTIPHTSDNIFFLWLYARGCCTRYNYTRECLDLYFFWVRVAY